MVAPRQQVSTYQHACSLHLLFADKPQQELQIVRFWNTPKELHRFEVCHSVRIGGF